MGNGEREEPWGVVEAPVTRGAFGRRDGPGPPGAIYREWAKIARHNQDVILCWAGEWNRNGTHLSWGWWNWAVGEHGAEHPHPAIRTPAANVERMLAPLAHESRVRLMQAMYDGPKASGELAQATRLGGGNLYYHLKELIHAAYVREVTGGYDLTPLGCQMLITVASIAEQVVKDRGEEGLLVAPTPPSGD